MTKVRKAIAAGLITTSTILAFTGCAPMMQTQLKVNKEVGMLNLKHNEFKQEKMTIHSIGIVSPEFKSEKEKVETDRYGRPVRSLNFNSSFANYQPELEEAMRNAFMEMVTKKGFKTVGPFKTFDDITYTEKKGTYLTWVPELSLKISKKATEAKRHALYYHEKGVITVTGELYMKVVEPLTKQAMINKRINLSDFDIKKEYIYDRQISTGGRDMTGALLAKAGAPDSIRDNTDKALTEALNEFYAKAIGKLDKYIDREEMLSLEPEILKLKGLKRF